MALSFNADRSFLSNKKQHSPQHSLSSLLELKKHLTTIYFFTNISHQNPEPSPRATHIKHGTKSIQP
jgi:hypothetical protein